MAFRVAFVSGFDGSPVATVDVGARGLACQTHLALCPGRATGCAVAAAGECGGVF